MQAEDPENLPAERKPRRSQRWSRLITRGTSSDLPLTTSSETDVKTLEVSQGAVVCIHSTCLLY